MVVIKHVYVGKLSQTRLMRRLRLWRFCCLLAAAALWGPVNCFSLAPNEVYRLHGGSFRTSACLSRPVGDCGNSGLYVLPEQDVLPDAIKRPSAEKPILPAIFGVPELLSVPPRRNRWTEELIGE